MGKLKVSVDSGRAVLSEPKLFFAISLESIPTDTALGFPIYLKVADNFVLFRPEGDVLSAPRVGTLKKQNADVVYVPKDRYATYLAMLESLVSSEDRGKGQELRLRHLLVGWEMQLEEQKRLEKPHFKKIMLLGSRMAEGIHANNALAGNLLRKFNDPALYYVNHSVNVALFGAAVAVKLKFSLEDLQKLTAAILLHNIGNLFMPKETLYRPGALSPEEWKVVREHPRVGAKLLESLGAPKEVVLTTRQHHERMDGEGYPDKLQGEQIHLFAKICSIADVYDSLTSVRPYRGPVSPQDAVEQLGAMKGKFDPNILSILTAEKIRG